MVSGPHAPSTLATSLCSVLTAIAGFIPEQTLSENFALNLIWADEYTGIKTNGKPVADGPRYKQLGNSMSTTVIQWLGRRINRFYNIDAEILSLLG